MKKVTVLLIVLALPLCMFAQHFGLQVGGSLTDVSYKSDLYSVNTQLKPGFMGGISIEFPLKNTMAINTSVNLQHKGTWIHDNQDLLAVRLNYINLDATYNYILHFESISLYFEGGGYLGYAAWGKIGTRLAGGEIELEDIKFGTNEADDIRPFDGGLLIGTGVYLGKFKLGVTYSPGLINISPKDDLRSRNMALTLKASYFFNM